jgi:hypothetical protein
MREWSGRWLCQEKRKGERERGTAEEYSDVMTSVERGARHEEELRVTHGNMCGCSKNSWNVSVAEFYMYAEEIANINNSECFSDNNSRYELVDWTVRSECESKT